MSDLTPERVSELFNYDPLTGVLTWKHSRGGQVSGSPAGCITEDGYRRVTTGRRSYLVHRLIWMLVYGAWPTNTIDHINGDKLDNRITNLRDVTRKTNKENMRKPRKDNTVGVLGVHWHKYMKKFQASIRTNGERIHLGTYNTSEEAHQAYLIAKRQLHAGNTL